MSTTVLGLRRLDLPLDQNAATRFLPWTVAALVYLAVLALAVAAVADGALRLYHMRAKLVTVTLPSVEDDGESERQIAAALDVLRETRGVTSATPVPEEELQKLIEPWLGEAKASIDLPLPRLIDVTLDPLAKPDLPTLQEKLRQVIEGATIGVEAIARDRAERMAAFFRAWGGAIAVAVLLGALGAAWLITRVSLRMQTETIELLRCIGAPDSYLARQYERHALMSALRGGLIGFALAVLTILAALYSGRRMELAGTVELNLQPVDWILLACVPIVVALLVTAIARMTALSGLRRLG